jgi:hypothetical protein
MKKWTPWLIGITILILLVIRLSYTYVNELEKEKAWYISELHYHCSLRVDSIVRRGRALVTLTSGVLDPQREWQLKDKLHAHGILHLIIVNRQRYDLRVPGHTLAKDSIYINSDRNLLSLYRDGKLLSNVSLTESLRQRPF